MLRECAASLMLLAAPGCSLVLDFSDQAIPRDAHIDAPDAPYTQAECDYQEPNDSLDAAAAVAPGGVGPAAICAASGGDHAEDHDYYKLTVPSTIARLELRLGYRYRATGDLDLRLYDAAGAVLAESRGFGDEELIECPDAAPPCAMPAGGDYVLEVFPAIAGAVNNYTLSIALTSR